VRTAAALALSLLLAGCATVSRSQAALSLDEKIGQLFVVVVRGGFVNEGSPEFRALLHQVRDNHVGGIHWASGSAVFETAFLTRRLQSIAKVPLMVSADLEAGPGMRLNDTTYWPWPMAVAATGDAELARREGEIIAQEARAIGLNQIYAPVADVNVNPDNPVINVRSFGEDPHEVARFVAAFVSGVQSQGVIATVKHFPGHGDTATDSHRSLPISNASRERLEQVELVPFRAAIAAGAASVMTAHLAVPSIDETPIPVRPGGEKENPYTQNPDEVTRDGTLPASLSPEITDGLLRGELGFQGLVVTDALDMGGIVDHFDPAEAVVRAILAGADQVLKSPDTDAAVAGVRRAVESGRIPRERLEESVRRVLAAKARFAAPSPDLEKAFRTVDEPAHRAVAEEIARRSLTLLREEVGALPLARERRVLLVTVNDSSARLADDLTRELKVRLALPPDRLALDARSTEADAQAVLDAAARADTVVVALFVRFESGKGSIATPQVARKTVLRLSASGARMIVVSFGSPYLLRELPEVKTYLAAYGGQTDSQIAAARALFGEAPITGRLPVTIPGVAERGSGIRKESRVQSRESGVEARVPRSAVSEFSILNSQLSTSQ